MENNLTKTGELPPETYEEQHVHTVYEQIASHFSSTRYKPWPIVSTFLSELRLVLSVSIDRSTNLVKIAMGHQPHSAVVADTLALPHQKGRFDFAISIAVVHHLSTRERRREAVHCILETLRDGGKALVYVWALEQKNSRRGWDEGHDQDVMVPWVMKTSKKNVGEDGETEKTFQRYYHLYRKGELEEDVTIGGRSAEDQEGVEVGIARLEKHTQLLQKSPRRKQILMDRSYTQHDIYSADSSYRSKLSKAKTMLQHQLKS
ncbi:hypothetical protein G7Y89_g10669 [Cudoniella acicularis]|uniref:Methyltransferase type 11 domain-containing protein n=1 Tax=Cudoniella acicularis TaxID=354080 RepID=A0A8H4RFZ5_9HELO|nr:hypothetical protein G7Y89_g10669 [Cudoniella acicularis]